MLDSNLLFNKSVKLRERAMACYKPFISLFVALVFCECIQNSFCETVASESAVNSTNASKESDTSNDSSKFCVDPSAKNNMRDKASKYFGPYVGFGISKLSFDRTVTASDNISEVMRDKEVWDWEDEVLIQKSANKFAGCVSLGWGNCWKKVYAGIDVTCDITDEVESTQRSTHRNYRKESTPPVRNRIKTGGATFTVAAKVGKYIESIDSLLYFRVGASFTKNKFTSDNFYKNKPFDWSIKTPVVSPVLGVGFEKIINEDSNVITSLRIEVDHRFKREKSAEFVTPQGYEAEILNKIKGNTFRVLLVCHM